MQTNRKLQDELTKELVKLREVGISQLDALKAGEPDVLLPRLDEAAQYFLQNRSGLTRSEAVAELLRQKIVLLSSPEYREWLPVSLGVKENLPTSDPKALNKMASRLAGYFNDDGFKRSDGRLQRAFQVLAAKIVVDCFQEQGLATTQLAATAQHLALSSEVEVTERFQAEPSFETPYVEHLEAEREFSQYLTLEPRIVGIFGISGAGKTRFALHYARKHFPSDYLWLDVGSEFRLTESIISILGHNNPGISDLGSMQLQRRLRAHLGSTSAPGLTILDNVRQYVDVEPLLYYSSRTTFIVTGNFPEGFSSSDHTILLEAKAEGTPSNWNTNTIQIGRGGFFGSFTERLEDSLGIVRFERLGEIHGIHNTGQYL